MVKEELPFHVLNLLTKLPTGRRTIQASLTQIHEGERVPIAARRELRSERFFVFGLKQA